MADPERIARITKEEVLRLLEEHGADFDAPFTITFHPDGTYRVEVGDEAVRREREREQSEEEPGGGADERQDAGADPGAADAGPQAEEGEDVDAEGR